MMFSSSTKLPKIKVQLMKHFINFEHLVESCKSTDKTSFAILFYFNFFTMIILLRLPFLLVVLLELYLWLCFIDYTTGLEMAKNTVTDGWLHECNLTRSTRKGVKQSLFRSENLNSIFLRKLDERYSYCNGIDVRELSILEVQELFARNQLTSVQLTSCYLQRIHRMNPFLNAVLEVNRNAMSEAFKADMERQENINGGIPYPDSPMHGIPVLLKDSIATKDYMETTAGSWALLGIKPKKDADVVERLRKAGAVIIGKANLSEFSGIRTLSLGWSGRGGQTKNPYNLAAEPYGSSTGSAVGIAANLAMVSLGEETCGSLMGPSSVSSICTLKPTVGLVSTEGLIPISHSQDCVGPMTRSTLDLAILFDEMVTQTRKNELACGRKSSFLKCLLNERYFKKYRVGVLRKPFWNVRNNRVLQSQFSQLEKMMNLMQASQNFEIVDVDAVNTSPLDKIDKEYIVLSHELKHGINNYLSNKVVNQYSEETGRKIRSLKDIIQFNNDCPEDNINEDDVWILAETTDGIQNKTYLEVLNNNQKAARGFLTFYLKKYKLDTLMFPLPFPESLRTSNLYKEDIESFEQGYYFAAIAGYPSMSIPAGFHSRSDVPFGVNFVGMPYSEATLLQIGYLVEQMNPIRRPPKFLDIIS